MTDIRVTDTAALHRRWLALVGDRTGAADAGADLLGRYAEPHRHYHDVDHLAGVLRALDEIAAATGAPADPAAELALWFHDAVYDPAATDNERRSAELAAAMLGALGMPGRRVREVVRLVLLTAEHDPAPDDRAGVAVTDADLAILATDPDEYRRYAAAVRAEYSHLGDGAFRAGRTAVLRGLLARPRLYRTPAARERWETHARTNITAEIERLTRLAGDGAAVPPRSAG